MPRFPLLSDRSHLIGGSVFEKFKDHLAALDEPPIKLHIGDTSVTPPYELPLSAAFLAANPATFQYCNTFGIAPLRRTLVEKLNTDNGLAVGDDQVMVTSGASNALSVTTQALLNPGDEVILLTPAWPFFAGMVRMAGATPVEIPFYSRLYTEPDLDITALLEAARTSSSAALYLNTPNNPSGKVLMRAQVEEIAAFCRAYDLWVISDEAYDGLTFDGREHVSIGALEDMFPRTISIFTCSKAFMFAGIRLGWVAADAAVLRTLNKTMIHQLYGPNTPGQEMMVEPIRRRHEWLPRVRDHYQQLRDRFLATLDLEIPHPEGTYFVLFSVEPFLGSRSMDDLIGECLEGAVTVAPGVDFGRGFEHHLRLCFTADDPERTLEGARRLRRVLVGAS